MKIRTLILFIVALFPLAGFAQLTFEGQVFNKTTEQPVSNVNVRLLNEDIAVITDAHGFFKLLSEKDSLDNDTLIFSAVGYVTARIAASEFLTQRIVVLTPATTILEEVAITDRRRKQKVLNKFDLTHVRDEPPRYVTHAFTPFSYFYAKLFTSPEEYSSLKKIQIGRRNFNGPRSPSRSTAHAKTRFLVHIMEVTTGGLPGKIRFTKTIELKNNSIWYVIDMSEDKITINGTQFFVAIEWLPIPFNEVVFFGSALKVERINRKGEQVHDTVPAYSIKYEPALIGYPRKEIPRAYIKDPRGNWVEHTEYDVALSATIEY
ncbi:carboxypeptidase-like regulatory domain-containing protein [Pedobacter faecalis]|uniref:carboxypeptidase-like regulatory domain-containing protein n=1 Tax=Pedobacter faecalis TaxID=3041495 RepID=UPI00254BAB71|nr:carboxypeptidase-like regulatory domain-containing protein [Pedobacter sp. ELA7]